jgi:hypothetical protein
MLYNLDKENTVLFLVVISFIGGIVNYCIERSTNRKGEYGFNFFISQVLVSGFTGFLGGLLCIEYDATPTMTLFISGVSGTIGSSLLLEFQHRVLMLIIGGNENKK